MAALMAAGGFCVLILGRMPMLETQMSSLRAAAVSADYPPVSLSDDNLVDAVGSIRLHHRLAHVGWDHSILAMDIMLRQGQHDPLGLAEDISALLRFSFDGTENVRQALIRVYRAADGRKELLFYGDLRREYWAKAGETQPEAASESAMLRSLLVRYRFSATAAGERWLQLLANS
jgi:hypothetical protein